LQVQIRAFFICNTRKTAMRPKGQLRKGLSPHILKK
jgi:hypothetical protein